MPTDTTKVVQLHAFAGPEVLVYASAPRPKLRSGEVPVRVHAAGLNPPDRYLRDGFEAPLPEWRPEGAFPIIGGPADTGHAGS